MWITPEISILEICLRYQMKGIENFFQNLGPTNQQILWKNLLPQGVATLGTLDPMPPLILNFWHFFVKFSNKSYLRIKKNKYGYRPPWWCYSPQKFAFLGNFWKFHFFGKKMCWKVNPWNVSLRPTFGPKKIKIGDGQVLSPLICARISQLTQKKTPYPPKICCFS